MKNLARVFIVCLTSFSLWSCQAPAIPKDVAKDISDSFIKATTSGKYPEAFKLVNQKEFFTARSDDQWIAYYDAISKELGPVVSIKLSHEQADDRFSGRFYTYVYSIKHENGFTKEIVTLVQEINSNADLKIFAHRVEGGKLRKINQMF
ncbi:MAG: hypothetical protein OEM38_03905 [Gammaproteobacteria bacterium]|nr:hypothetical protein [Gammaproteobacteria bacterium]